MPGQRAAAERYTHVVDEKVERLADVLRRNAIFAGLSDVQIDGLIGRAVSMEYAPGQAIFGGGDRSEALFAVQRGHVRIAKTSIDGDEVTLGIINPGEIFGEIAVLDGGVRSAGTYAFGSCRLSVIRRGDFLEYLRSDQDLSLRVIEVLCKRLRSTIDQVETIAFQALEARLARVLVTLAETYGVRSDEGLMIDMRLGQRELGAFIATTRESVGKQLSRWRERGLVSRSKGRLVLRDVEALRSISSLD